MQRNFTTTPQVSKVKITFTKRKMTAYGGFALLASFFERIGFAGMIEKAMPITECSPNTMGIYGKSISFIAMIFAGAERFSHLMYLGNKDVLARIFGVRKLPDAATTLTRMFNKLKTVRMAETFSSNVWTYLCRLIPWNTIREDWLTFDSTVLLRYGEQEGAKRGYNPVKHGRPSHSPLLAFLNRSKYGVHLWNRSGNVASWNNILAFFTDSYGRIRDRITVSGVIADSGFYLKQFIEMLERHTAHSTADILPSGVEGNRTRAVCLRVLLYASPRGKGEAVHCGAAGYYPQNKSNGEDLPSFCP